LPIDFPALICIWLGLLQLVIVVAQIKIKRDDFFPFVVDQNGVSLSADDQSEPMFLT